MLNKKFSGSSMYVINGAISDKNPSTKTIEKASENIGKIKMLANTDTMFILPKKYAITISTDTMVAVEIATLSPSHFGRWVLDIALAIGLNINAMPSTHEKLIKKPTS